MADIRFDSWQEALLQSTAPRLLVDAPRRSGKTTAAAALAASVAATGMSATVLSRWGQQDVMAQTMAQMRHWSAPHSLDNVRNVGGDNPCVLRGNRLPHLIVVDDAELYMSDLLAGLDNVQTQQSRPRPSPEERG